MIRTLGNDVSRILAVATDFVKMLAALLLVKHLRKTAFSSIEERLSWINSFLRSVNVQNTEVLLRKFHSYC